MSRLYSLRPLGVLLDPLLGELAVLDFLEDLAHLFLGLVVDDARAAREVAVLGRVGDELVHLGEAAFVQQVDDELQLVQALVVRDFGLIAGFHQRLEALEHELGRAAAEHGLLAEQIRLGLFGERRLEHAAAGAADAVRVGEGLGDAPCRSHPGRRRSGTARRDPAGTGGARGRRGPSGAISTTSRSLRGLICLKWMLKPCANSSVGAFLQATSRPASYRSFCARSGTSMATRSAPAAASAGSATLRPSFLRLLPAGAVLANADDDVEAAVLEVERMRAALAAVAQDGDPAPS